MNRRLTRKKMAHARRLPASLYYGSETPMSADARPVYLKLRDIIAEGIIDGTWPDGTMLPSVRAFAAERGANPLTVSKAYQQFLRDGLIEVRRGIGMVVSPGAGERLRLAERQRFLAEEWPSLRARVKLLGIDVAQLAAAC
jgi:GntR family transcriptional regulator